MTTGDTVQQMGTSILAPGSISGATSNPAGLILISLLALVAVVVVWFALTIRKLLIIVAAILSPFAFAGSLADFSRSWVRRWVELIIALVFSKLILIFVFVIGLEVLLKGVGSTGSGGAQGITQTVTGILILALAGLAPWVAIKMAHFAGVHLEGMHMMAGHATAGATTVQSMARPVGAAVMPGGMAGAAAAGWCRRAQSRGRRRQLPAQARRHAGGTETVVCGRTVCPVECRCRSGLIRSCDSVSERERPVLERVDPRSHRGGHLCSREQPRRRLAPTHPAPRPPRPGDRPGVLLADQPDRRSKHHARLGHPTSPPAPPFQTRPPTAPTNPPKGNPVP